MKSFNRIENFNSNKSTILTIGTFDGVHLGHQKILKKLLQVSNNKDLESTVLTFFPHPRTILNPSKPLKLINSINERIDLFKKSHIKNLIIHPFDKSFSLLSADQFIKDYLIEKLKINHIIIGYDHRFGKGREASVDDLKKYGESFDFIVEEIKAHEVESIAVSSTKIRDSINNGELDKSAKFLGRFFKLTGKVVKGDGLGKQMNYPTANIYVEENYKIIPKDGVYLIKTLIDDKEFHGMMNIGHRPTIGKNKKSIEVHLFDFDNDIYDKTISVDVLLKIRDEIKFSSIEALKEQLKKDEAYCTQLINK